MTSWAKVLFRGLGVAVFTFAATPLWNSHRSVGPDYVHVALRVEYGALLLFVRNESDEPLDLVRTEISLNQAKNHSGVLRAYPAPSRLYEVHSALRTELAHEDEKPVVKLRIAQAIEPDQFGTKSVGDQPPLVPDPGIN